MSRERSVLGEINEIKRISSPIPLHPLYRDKIERFTDLGYYLGLSYLLCNFERVAQNYYRIGWVIFGP